MWDQIRILARDSNHENTPRGSYRDQHSHLHFDYTWPEWRHYVEEYLWRLGYSRTAQIEAWIGTDYFNPERDDQRIFPADAELIRNQFREYTIGRDTALNEQMEDLELQNNGLPTFNRNVPSIPRPGPSQTRSFPTRSSSPQRDDPTPTQLSRDPHAPHRIDMSASKGKGKALFESEPLEDLSGNDKGAPPDDPEI